MVNITKLNDLKSEIAEMCDKFISSDQIIVGKTNILASLDEIASSLFDSFHYDKMCKLRLIWDNETWILAVVPLKFQELLDSSIIQLSKINNLNLKSSFQTFSSANSDSILTSSSSLSINSSYEHAFLYFNGQKYFITSCLLLSIQIFSEYINMICDIHSLVVLIFPKILNIITEYAKSVHLLILDAEVIHTAGIKQITCRNIMLASRTIEFVLEYLKILRICLSPDQLEIFSDEIYLLENVLFDEITAYYNKLNSFVEGFLIENLSQWITDENMHGPANKPSPFICAFLKMLKRYHSAIHDVVHLEYYEQNNHKLWKIIAVRMFDHVINRHQNLNNLMSYLQTDLTYLSNNLKVIKGHESVDILNEKFKLLMK